MLRGFTRVTLVILGSLLAWLACFTAIYVLGALACAQGVVRTQGGALLTSARAIAALRATGSPQQDEPGRPATQRIGNRPNLRQLIPSVADGWSNNRTVVRTHAKHQSQMAWAILDGTGWMSRRWFTARMSSVLDALPCPAVCADASRDDLQWHLLRNPARLPRTGFAFDLVPGQVGALATAH